MNIIIDANIIVSALLKNSTNRHIIIEYEGFFLCPGFLLTEIEKYKEEITRRTG